MPFTISALSASDLARSNVTKPIDLNQIVSGFTRSGQGSVTIPSIRGVSSQLSAAGTENANAFYIDGVYRGVHVLLTTDVPDVERVEVQKGPQGTLFGRNSTGGAIQFFTKRPSFTPDLNIVADSGYYPGAGTSRSSLHENIRGYGSGPLIDDKVAASIAVGYNWVQGYLTNDKTNSRDGEDSSKNARAKLLFTPTDSIDILLTGFVIRQDLQSLVVYNAINGLSAANFPLYPGAVYSTVPWHGAHEPGFGKSTMDSSGASANMSLETVIGTFTSISSYSKTSQFNRSDVHGAAGPPSCFIPAGANRGTACVAYTSPVRSIEVQQELNYASNEIGPLSVVAGLFYYASDSSQNNTINGGQPANLNEVDKTSYAVYGQGTFKATPELRVIAGVRQSREIVDATFFGPLAAGQAIQIGKNTFTAATPRVSVVYDITPQLNVYGTYSQGFKSGLPQVLNIIPQDLLPERNTAYEAGVKYGSATFTASLSVFHYDYSNLQVSIFQGTRSAYVNADAKYTGFDADVSVVLSESLKLRGNAEWLPTAKFQNYANSGVFTATRRPSAPGFTQDGTFAPATINQNGQRMIRAPKFTANLSVLFNQSYSFGAVDAALNGSYSSEYDQEISRIVHQKAYTTLGAQIGVTPPGSRFRIGLYGKNLTNVAAYANGISSGQGFIAGFVPPLEMGITASFKLN